MVLNQRILDPLGHTAYHTEDKLPGFLAAQRREILQAVDNLLLRVVADGTGVQQYRVGLLGG